MLSKAVLISIRPQWVEKIVRGEKTIEVRKTKPKIQTPFKCYIYCTLGKMQWNPGDIYSHKIFENGEFSHYEIGNGKVIGEFICNDVYQIPIFDGIVSSMDVVMSCLDDNEILEYAGEKPVYACHISDLKIYDKPRELSEFYRLGEEIYCDAGLGGKCMVCEHWKSVRVNADEFEMDCDIGGFLGYEKIPITRPPQSWCYVEELSIEN